MDTRDFPELGETSDLELLRARRELLELKSRVAKYEQILRENELLDSAPAISDMEMISVRELARFNELSAKNIPLSLEDIKVIDILHKNLLLAQGKAPVVVEKKTKKEEQADVATLLKLATSKEK